MLEPIRTRVRRTISYGGWSMASPNEWKLATKIAIATGVAVVAAGAGLVSSNVIGPCPTGGDVAAACPTPTTPNAPIATTTNPPPSVASYFISASGTDAGTSPTACTNEAAPCRTFGFAYSKANLVLGDKIVSVAPGNYPLQTVLRGSQTQSGGQICFVGGPAVVVAGISSGANNGSMSGETANNLCYDGINVENGSVVTYYNDFMNVNPQPVNFKYKNAHIYCNLGDCGTMLYLRDIDGVEISGVEVAYGCCNVDAVVLAGSRNDAKTVNNVQVPCTFGVDCTQLAAPGIKNLMFKDSVIHDIYDSCTHENAAVKAAHPCAGTGYGDTGQGQHPDGIQAFGCNHCDFLRNRIHSIDAVNATAPSGGNGQGFFLQPANGPGGDPTSTAAQFSDLTFAGNSLTCACGTNTWAFAGPGTGLYSGYIRINSNTLASGQAIKFYDHPSTTSVFAPGTTIDIGSNIITAATNHNDASTACNILASDGSTITPNYSHNQWPVGTRTCSGTDVLANAVFTDTSFWTPDLHLSGSQTASTGGETGTCTGVTADYDGDPRPGADGICAIGADEPTPVNPAPVCTPSPCTNGTWVTHTIPNVNDGAGKLRPSMSYLVYRPGGLTKSATNLVPVVVCNGTQSTSPVGVCDWWVYEATQSKFIIVQLVRPFSAWQLPLTAGGLSNTFCGTNGTTQCDDKPYIARVMADIYPGGTNNEFIDTTKVFDVGGSNSGQASIEAMCGTNTAPYFTGFESFSIQFRSANGSAFTPCPGIGSRNISYSLSYAHFDTGMICPLDPTSVDPAPPHAVGVIRYGRQGAAAINDTNCEPGTVNNTGNGLFYWGGFTSLADLGTLIGCDNALTVTNPTTKWQFKTDGCPSGKKIRVGVESADGHSWGIAAGLAGNWNTPNTPNSQAPGFDYMHSVWLFLSS